MSLFNVFFFTILKIIICFLYKRFPSKTHAFFTEPFTILTSSTGRSFLSVSTSPILFTIVMPEWTLPVK